MFRTALISLFLTSTALATTWTVDDDGGADFLTIQAAVNAASDGDEIIVSRNVHQQRGELRSGCAGQVIVDTQFRWIWGDDNRWRRHEHVHVPGTLEQHN